MRVPTGLPMRLARGWPALIVTAAARAALSMVAGLLLWAQAPALIGWTPTLVSSGSMEPLLMPGDVAVFDHVPDPHAGQVILFHDPAKPTRLMAHRVHKVLPDGDLITGGDANRAVDSTPVPPALYLGIGRLRVPDIGLPVYWWREHSYLPVALTAAIAMITIALAMPGPESESARSR